jgi:hypothetical protein
MHNLDFLSARVAVFSWAAFVELFPSVLHDRPCGTAASVTSLGKNPMTELLCARCLQQLHAGTGDFFRVTIEAVADPSAPALDEEASAAEGRRRIEELLAQMKDVSEREAMDQVHRRVVLHLCGPCYRQWIEDPAGRPER